MAESTVNGGICPGAQILEASRRRGRPGSLNVHDIGGTGDHILTVSSTKSRAAEIDGTPRQAYQPSVPSRCPRPAEPDFTGEIPGRAHRRHVGPAAAVLCTAATTSICNHRSIYAYAKPGWQRVNGACHPGRTCP